MNHIHGRSDVGLNTISGISLAKKQESGKQPCASFMLHKILDYLLIGILFTNMKAIRYCRYGMDKNAIRKLVI